MQSALDKKKALLVLWECPIMHLYLTGPVPMHLPGKTGFFMMEPFLMETEGSQNNSPLFSHLQADQKHISLTLIHLLGYSLLFVASISLTWRDQCCPMEASWHRTNCVPCSGSHWAQAGCKEWCFLMFSPHLSQCIWDKLKVESHVIMQIILYVILSHLVCFFEDPAGVIKHLMKCFPFNIVSF